MQHCKKKRNVAVYCICIFVLHYSFVVLYCIESYTTWRACIVTWAPSIDNKLGGKLIRSPKLKRNDVRIRLTVLYWDGEVVAHVWDVWALHFNFVGVSGYVVAFWKAVNFWHTVNTPASVCTRAATQTKKVGMAARPHTHTYSTHIHTHTLSLSLSLVLSFSLSLSLLHSPFLLSPSPSFISWS